MKDTCELPERDVSGVNEKSGALCSTRVAPRVFRPLRDKGSAFYFFRRFLMNIQAPKGTKDVVPQESGKWQHL